MQCFMALIDATCQHLTSSPFTDGRSHQVAAIGSPPGIAIGDGACGHKHSGAQDDTDADVREVEPACQEHVMTVLAWLLNMIGFLLARQTPRITAQAALPKQVLGPTLRVNLPSMSICSYLQGTGRGVGTVNLRCTCSKLQRCYRQSCCRLHPAVCSRPFGVAKAMC
jgi:hypothetical protein